MDTVKVSLDRLQILNDRINLAIVAFNELRCSVHGLERTSGAAVGSTATLVGDITRGVPAAAITRGVPAMAGLAHSSAIDSTMAATAYRQAMAADRLRAYYAAYPSSPAA